MGQTVGKTVPLVETRGLTKHYASVKALDGCDLTVPKGSIFGLLGPNGAGKSTLMRTLLGFLRPTSGTGRVDGHDCVTESRAIRSTVSYLPAQARLPRMMTGRTLLRFFASLRPDGNFEQSLAIADRLELDLRRRVWGMSTGMKQKVALAIAFGNAAKLLILDEPTENLDPTIRYVVSDLVREAHARGQTVLFSSHVLTEVEDLCDRVAVLRAGRIVTERVMADILRRHRVRLVGAKDPLKLPPEIAVLSRHLPSDRPGEVWFETEARLAEIFAFLADVTVADVAVEPVGLRSVYEHFHPPRPRAIISATPFPFGDERLPVNARRELDQFTNDNSKTDHGDPEYAPDAPTDPEMTP